MSKKIIIALLLMALSVIVMIMTRGTVELNLLGYIIKPLTSFAILGCVALGVAIGVLLK